MYRTLPFIALCGVAVAAQADPRRGGFQGPDNFQPVTVAEAAGLSDDTDVRLEGFIVRALGDEKYEFRDDTGTLVVEIDDDDWGGIDVTPDVRIRLQGEIDHERQGVELDVDDVRAVE
jgi:uncharacterized protein (TIGR00156 family)